jgi:polysaccharide biosynthesis transport protein
MNVEQTQELDIKRYVHLVLKRRYLFAAVAAVIIAVVVAASYVIPPVYEAKTVVSIEKSFLNNVIKNIGAVQTVDDKASALSTIMKSRTLVYKVISDLGLDVNGMTEAQLEGLIKGTQDKTQITIEFNKSGRKDVDFFTVSFRDRDPRRARDYVNNLVSRYIEENLSGKREDSFGANRFLLDQINHYKDAVAKLDTEIAMLKKDRNVMLHDRMLELQKRLDDLLVQYTESHPDVVKARSEIDSLKWKFRTSRKKPDADDQENQPPETSSAAVARAAYTKNQIAALERERDTNKKIYDELAAAYGKSEVSSQAEIQDKAGTFRIVDPAVLPIKPVSLNRIMIILLGIAGGLAGAFGVLLALDTFDKSVKTIDVLRGLGIPVLAVIPHIESPDELIKAKRKDAYFYGLSGLFVVLLGAVIVRELLVLIR